jgi:hypothetical protein
VWNHGQRLRNKNRFAEVKTELLERIEKVETTLLTEFHKYAQASEPDAGD